MTDIIPASLDPAFGIEGAGLCVVYDTANLVPPRLQWVGFHTSSYEFQSRYIEIIDGEANIGVDEPAYVLGHGVNLYVYSKECTVPKILYLTKELIFLNSYEFLLIEIFLSLPHMKCQNV